MLRRESKQENPQKEVRSEELLYGTKLPLKRPEASDPEVDQVIEEAPVETRDGYKVSVRETPDPFLASSGHGWIYRVVSPEGDVSEGSARTRRKAERCVRKVIAEHDDLHKAARAEQEDRARLEDALLGAGISDDSLYPLLHKSRATSVEQVTGGYYLIMSKHQNSWGNQQWEIVVLKERSQILKTSIRASSKSRDGGRRETRKMALERLREVLLKKAMEEEAADR